MCVCARARSNLSFTRDSNQCTGSSGVTKRAQDESHKLGMEINWAKTRLIIVISKQEVAQTQAQLHNLQRVHQLLCSALDDAADCGNVVKIY